MLEPSIQARERCWTCWRPARTCLCPLIRAVETETRFVLLMHPKEARKQKLGTGRLTHACLPNSEIRIGLDFTDDDRVNRLIDDASRRAFLLYPGGSPIREVAEEGRDGRPRVVFVLDGTWPATKSVMKRSANLRRLPRLSIDPESPSRFSIKQQPGELCLSTIESVHRLVEECNRAGVEDTGGRHDVLLDLLDEMCRRQISLARDPNRKSYRRGPYKEPGERTPSRKWRTRKFFLP